MTIHLINKLEVNGFVLTCHFNTSEVVEYDMSDIKTEIGIMSEPLKDINYFKEVFLESGIPTWKNGYDVCPEEIFRTGKKIKIGKQVA